MVRKNILKCSEINVLKEEIKKSAPNIDVSNIRLTNEDIANFDKETQENEVEQKKILKEYMGKNYDLSDPSTTLEEKLNNYEKQMAEADRKIEKLRVKGAEGDPELEGWLNKLDVELEYQNEV
jgi:predicted AlkP superfamily phosphohydrolase/phosphomutase